MKIKPIVLLFIVSLISTASAQSEPKPIYTFTYHTAEGNRIVPGQSTFPNAEVKDIAVNGEPFWVVGGLVRDDFEWEVRMKDGTAGGYMTSDGRITSMGEGDGIHAPPMMLRQKYVGDFLNFSDNNFGDGSRHTHPIVFDKLMMYVNNDYAVVLWHRKTALVNKWWVRALPDARIAMSETGLGALYAASTKRYAHGVLGDELEGEMAVIYNVATLSETRITLPENDVFEGIMPFWADVDGDGVQDLVTTVSNSEVGARIRVYKTDGSMLAEGEPIGQGGRWRHQLAFGAFGANGENELVAVRTPHIGGIVEFYRYEDGKLNIVAELPGFSSHQIGSRNLDMAVGGDFDGDGQIEIVLPDQAMQTLNGIQRTENGAEVVWSVPLDGTLTTNLAAIQYGDGKLALAAGTDDGKLRVWLSEDAG